MGQEYISTWEAFLYCLTTTSYVVWLAIGFLVLIAGIVAIRTVLNDGTGWGAGNRILVMGLCILFFILTLIVRPSEISANTTKEQAARGVYIGY